jgi:type II secretory pathway pseudopilin PulG
MEILIVVVIVGVLSIMTAPRIKSARDSYSVNAARERVTAAVAAARAAAIHTGRESLFLTSGQYISVWTKNPTTGFWQQQLTMQHIGSTHDGVQLQLGGSGWSYVWYEPRGLTLYKPSATTVFRLVGSTKRDSVCVSRMGQILPRSCTL